MSGTRTSNSGVSYPAPSSSSLGATASRAAVAATTGSGSAASPQRHTGPSAGEDSRRVFGATSVAPVSRVA